MGQIPSRDTIVHNTLTKDLTRLVQEITIAGTAILPGNPPDSVYHFRLSLVFENQTAIRLDINPYELDSPIKTRGRLTIESKGYPKSKNNTISWGCALNTPTEAGNILKYILVKKKRDQYDFDSNGEGCRFWCETILKDLIDMGLVSADELAKFNAWEKEEKKKQGDRLPMPKPQGVFYG
ncbi:hypothetical protein AX16_005884 [Volvariella volvacea WC 439]|nr:hypothetical protein AX16_005884 [Volvariella volvacea WC 439]